MSTASSIPWGNSRTVFVNEDGQLTPPPNPVLIANTGPVNGSESSVSMTDDDVSEMSETLTSDSENQLMVDVQLMAGAVGDENSGSDGSVEEYLIAISFYLRQLNHETEGIFTRS